MTDGSIFTDDKSAATSTDTATGQEEQTSSSIQTQSDMVAALVGEGKKYKTVDDLAKAYISADEFIEKLKLENHELREKTTAAKTIDDVLERLNQRQNIENADQQPSVTDLTKLVEQAVTGLETKKQRESNLLKADKLMKEMYGEKAGDKFAELASTPELKTAYMQLASVDPDKFVSLFSGGKPPSTGVETSSGVNTTISYTSTNGVRVNQEGTKEYFDNIRRTNPTMYYSQDFQLKMDKTVRSNPDVYYGKR